MNQQFGYAQVPCSKCGATVWISPQVGMGVCPQCHTQTRMPPQAAPPPQWASQPGAPIAGAPQQWAPQPGAPMPGAPMPGAWGGPQPAAGYSMPMGYRPPGMAFSYGRFVLAIIVAIVVGGGSIGAYTLKNRFFGKKGVTSYSSIGIDPDHADGDALIANVAPVATKWKKDAGWWSANFQKVRPDGSVELDAGAEVEYVSPSGVMSLVSSIRKDSIKKFRFGTKEANHGDLWGARDAWKNVVLPPRPACSIKQLAGSLAGRGLSAGKTVRITYDPQFSSVSPAEASWHVIGTDPVVNAWFSMASCAETHP